MQDLILHFLLKKKENRLSGFPLEVMSLPGVLLHLQNPLILLPVFFLITGLFTKRQALCWSFLLSGEPDFPGIITETHCILDQGWE